MKIQNLKPLPTTTTEPTTTIDEGNDIDEDIQEKEEASLSVVEASSVYLNDFEKWGPEQALSDISYSDENFWHSALEDANPSITFKMTDEYEVISVEVVDRLDNHPTRFKMVEVRVGSTKSFEDAESCGMKSYSGKTP